MSRAWDKRGKRRRVKGQKSRGGDGVNERKGMQ